MSTLRVNAIESVAGVGRYTAAAWVNFNGTGTVAIRAAGNVSSITDNGTGDYNINFTSNMADVNYVVVGVVAPADTNRNNFAVGPYLNGNPTTAPEGNTKLVNTFRVTTSVPGSTAQVDFPSVYATVFR